MARTGRFGRLPTQAPDLSSQIVSMIEQFQNAEDNNILDAWQSGGKYKGKKVTDKRILDYYKKRRNSYDRDDPEYTEWDNEVWQMRFRISNEKTMMDYRMGRIGEQAVAKHYRTWARKMPKNSSYYRNMMQSAGEFAKAASAGRAAASKEFDYEGMMKKFNSHNKPIRAFDTIQGVIDQYAISQNLIAPGESVFDLTSMQAGDFGWLMSAVQENTTGGWGTVQEAIAKDYPDWNGQLSWEKVNRMADRAIAAKREQIQVLKTAPFDTSSQRQGLRADIRGIRKVKRLEPWADVMQSVKEASVEWANARDEAAIGEGPEETVKPDAEYLDSLSADYEKLMDIGGSEAIEQAADVAARILAVGGSNEQWLQNNPQWSQEAMPQWVQDQATRDPSDQDILGMTAQETEALKNNTGYIHNGIKQLKNREPGVFLVRNQNPTSSSQTALGIPPSQDWTVEQIGVEDRNTGAYKLTDPSQAPVTGFLTDGSPFQEMKTGEVIMGAEVDGVPQPIGYEFVVDGVKVYRMKDPNDPTRWDFVWDSPFPNGLNKDPKTGALVPVLSTEGEGNAYADYVSGISADFQQNPTAIVEGLESDPVAQRFGSMEQETKGAGREYNEGVKERNEVRRASVDATEFLEDRGLDDLGVINTLIGDDGELILSEQDLSALQSRVNQEFSNLQRFYRVNGSTESMEATYRNILRSEFDVAIPITAEDSRWYGADGQMHTDWQAENTDDMPPVRNDIISDGQAGAGEAAAGGAWEQIGGEPGLETEPGTTTTAVGEAETPTASTPIENETPEGWFIPDGADAYEALNANISFLMSNEAKTFTSLDSAVASRSDLLTNLTQEKVQAYAETFMSDPYATPDSVAKNVLELENQVFLADLSQQEKIVGTLDPESPVDMRTAGSILGGLNKRREERQTDLYPIFESLGAVPDDLSPVGAASFDARVREGGTIPTPDEAYLPQPLAQRDIDRFSQANMPNLDITKPIEIQQPKVPPPPSLQSAMKQLPTMKVPQPPPPPSLSTAMLSLPKPPAPAPPPPPTIESAMRGLR